MLRLKEGRNMRKDSTYTKLQLKRLCGLSGEVTQQRAVSLAIIK